ncbi:MAG: hypothetical protein PHV30_09390 [Candidatus Margulisbacteria bacterium]|nr:hypothetical protein [Candidatus Margulisiibacteriota bacterium]
MKCNVGIILLLSFLFAADLNFSAKDIMMGDKKAGEVYYNGQVIMRLISKGEYQSPYARAQIIAARMNENVKSLNDLKRITFTYPLDIYTASIDRKKLFAVYADEVALNNSTPEGLMSDWMNNLKKAMIPEQQKAAVAKEAVAGSSTGLKKVEVKDAPVKKVEVTKAKAQDTKVLEMKERSEDAVENILKDNTTSNITGNEEKISVTVKQAVEPEAVVKEKSASKKEKKKSQKSSNGPAVNLGIMPIVFFLIDLGVSVFLLLLYFRMKKQIGDFSKIDNTDKLEELENSVSVLIKELQETSDKVTEKTKTAINELENKIKEVKSTPAPATAPIKPEPVKVSEPPKVEKPAPAMPEVEVKEALPEPPKEEPKIEEPKNEEPKQEASKPVAEDKTIAEQLAEEIEKQSVEEEQNKEPETEAKKVSIEFPPDIDPDIKVEIENIVGNEALSRNEKVVQLASINIFEDEIAKYLGLGVGEVQLILQLNK